MACTRRSCTFARAQWLHAVCQHPPGFTFPSAPDGVQTQFPATCNHGGYPSTSAKIGRRIMAPVPREYTIPLYRLRRIYASQFTHRCGFQQRSHFSFVLTWKRLVFFLRNPNSGFQSFVHQWHCGGPLETFKEARFGLIKLQRRIFYRRIAVFALHHSKYNAYLIFHSCRVVKYRPLQISCAIPENGLGLTKRLSIIKYSIIRSNDHFSNWSTRYWLASCLVFDHFPEVVWHFTTFAHCSSLRLPGSSDQTFILPSKTASIFLTGSVWRIQDDMFIVLGCWTDGSVDAKQEFSAAVLVASRLVAGSTVPALFTPFLGYWQRKAYCHCSTGSRIASCQPIPGQFPRCRMIVESRHRSVCLQVFFRIAGWLVAISNLQISTGFIFKVF